MRCLWTSLAVLFGACFGFAAEPPPKLLAKSALVLDERSGKVLYAKNADTVCFPASTTKIMTALLLLERCAPDELIAAPADVEQVPPSSLHLKPGETLTARDMLYALLIRSANDAAYAVAVHIGGSEAGFAKLMNERAKSLGCEKTNFVNPHGLNDPRHVSTARDLSRIALHAMQNPEFRKAAATRKHIVSRSMNQDDLWLVTKNRVMKHDPTADGVKTGYTRPAGYCYVGSATRNGTRFYSILLGSTSDWPTDHKALINWAFKNHVRSRLEAPGEVLRDVPVLGGERPAVKAAIREPIFYAHRRDRAPQFSATVKPVAELAAPIQEGALLGTVAFADGEGWSMELPLYAVEPLGIARFRLNALANPGPATVLIACVLGGGAIWMRKRAQTLGS
jgi:serine-type D-Ala-D-Ala carboxypeptidase (penicillin-binding protein 5/6)